jgi:NADPH:quinone reductase-like Zn-dependent oxidoreductase
MSTGWQLQVERSDVSSSRLLDVPAPEPGAGELVLRTSLVAVTANTTAYAELGETLRYFDFYPVADPRWAVAPLWGFGDVVASRVDGVAEGTRVYGFVPAASHALLRPEVVSEGRFRDRSGLRAELPTAYNNYWATDLDPSYVPADREDLQVVFRPLFITSWALADWLVDGSALTADRVLISSASSKTAYGAALLLHARSERPRLVGLTSAGNLEYVTGLGVYDEVVTYDDAASLTPIGTSLYVDLAGSADVRASLRAALGASLQREVVVGLTHHEGLPEEDASGATEFWFAPEHLAARGREWGPGVLHQRFSADYRAALPTLESWVRVRRASGPEAFRSAWEDVLAGRVTGGAAPVIDL